MGRSPALGPLSNVYSNKIGNDYILTVCNAAVTWIVTGCFEGAQCFPYVVSGSLRRVISQKFGNPENLSSERNSLFLSGCLVGS